MKPGPGWPIMCRGCFAAIDARSEGIERLTGGWVFAPEEMSGPGLRLLRPVADLTGQRFGRLVVKARAVVEGSGRTRQAWRVQCGCGEVFVILPETLKRGARQCVRCAGEEGGRHLIALGRVRAA